MSPVKSHRWKSLHRPRISIHRFSPEALPCVCVLIKLTEKKRKNVSDAHIHTHTAPGLAETSDGCWRAWRAETKKTCLGGAMRLPAGEGGATWCPRGLFSRRSNIHVPCINARSEQTCVHAVSLLMDADSSLSTPQLVLPRKPLRPRDRQEGTHEAMFASNEPRLPAFPPRIRPRHRPLLVHVVRADHASCKTSPSAHAADLERGLLCAQQGSRREPPGRSQRCGSAKP